MSRLRGLFRAWFAWVTAGSVLGWKVAGPAVPGAVQRRDLRGRGRRRLDSRLLTRPGSCAGDRVLAASDGAVDGGAGDAEQVADFAGGVLAGVEQFDQVRFLPWVQFRLLATQMPFRLRDPHSFPSPGADEIAFELRDHGEDVEQQPPHRVGRVVDRRAEAEPDFAFGQVLGDRTCVGQGAGQPVQLGDHQRVASAAGGQCLAQTGPFPIGAGQAVVDVDALHVYAERGQSLALSGEVLFFGGYTGVSDQ